MDEDLIQMTRRMGREIASPCDLREFLLAQEALLVECNYDLPDLVPGLDEAIALLTEDRASDLSRDAAYLGGLINELRVANVNVCVKTGSDALGALLVSAACISGCVGKGIHGDIENGYEFVAQLALCSGQSPWISILEEMALEWFLRCPLDCLAEPWLCYALVCRRSRNASLDEAPLASYFASHRVPPDDIIRRLDCWRFDTGPFFDSLDLWIQQDDKCHSEIRSCEQDAMAVLKRIETRAASAIAEPRTWYW